MYIDLLPLQTSYAENFGGLPYFLFVPREWIATAFYPDKKENVVNVAPTLIAGKDWLKAECLVDTMGYEEKEKVTTSGRYFVGTISGAILKDDVVKINLTDTLSFHELVVIYYDRNNTGRIIGNKDFGMRFKSDFTTGSHRADSTMYSFTLEISLTKRAPLYYISGSSQGASGYESINNYPTS
jgi:hypothetical protein